MGETPVKKIGLVGGIGPASTIEYYRGLIQKCQNELGQNVYPEIVIDSVNMTKHDEALRMRNYQALSGYLLEHLLNLKAAGAEIAAITANAEHIVWELISDKTPIPTISIVDAVVNAMKEKKYKRVLILGTEYIMRSDLYKEALRKNEIMPIIPTNEDIVIIGNLIFPNLENGVVIEEDKVKLIQLAEKYVIREQADAILLGCTELPLAIKENDVRVPILNSTEIHINKIYDEAVS